jgi:hypothetical protein
MKEFFYKEDAIKRFVFVALNTETKPDPKEIKRYKFFEKLFDLKSSATQILVKEKPSEDLLTILSSNSLLNFLFSWLSQPFLDVDDCNIDQLFFSYSNEMKLEYLHSFLIKLSFIFWGQVKHFLILFLFLLFIFFLFFFYF